MRAIRCNQSGPPESLTVENLPELLPEAGQVLPSSWRDPMLKFWPTQAGGQMLNVVQQAHALSPWAGLGLLAGFTVLVGAVASARFVCAHR